jgi:hypothetical protein
MRFILHQEPVENFVAESDTLILPPPVHCKETVSIYLPGLKNINDLW